MKKLNLVIAVLGYAATYLTVFLSELWIISLSTILVATMMFIQGCLTTPGVEEKEGYIKTYFKVILTLILLIILGVNAQQIPFFKPLMDNWFMAISASLTYVGLVTAVPFSCGKGLAEFMVVAKRT